MTAMGILGGKIDPKSANAACLCFNTILKAFAVQAKTGKIQADGSRLLEFFPDPNEPKKAEQDQEKITSHFQALREKIAEEERKAIAKLQ